mmetsp:Transcript_33885/g.96912  ORF Transcript_33885/g.96912 Transcript_33885/m.96912 type:complete len:247 (+) Transcript_33885:303-1043(+)
MPFGHSTSQKPASFSMSQLMTMPMPHWPGAWFWSAHFQSGPGSTRMPCFTFPAVTVAVPKTSETSRVMKRMILAIESKHAASTMPESRIEPMSDAHARRPQSTSTMPNMSQVSSADPKISTRPTCTIHAKKQSSSDSIVDDGVAQMRTAALRQLPIVPKMSSVILLLSVEYLARASDSRTSNRLGGCPLWFLMSLAGTLAGTLPEAQTLSQRPLWLCRGERLRSAGFRLRKPQRSIVPLRMAANVG